MKKEPSILTTLHPDDVLGFSKGLVTRHYKASCDTESKEQFDKSMEAFSSTDRKTVALIYADLRNQGFYPIGLKGDGQIKWGQRVG